MSTDTIDTKALLPCPFCGSEAEFESDGGAWAGARCTSCGVMTPMTDPDTDQGREYVAALWNSRHAADRLAALEEENGRLRGALHEIGRGVKHGEGRFIPLGAWAAMDVAREALAAGGAQ